MSSEVSPKDIRLIRVDMYDRKTGRLEEQPIPRPCLIEKVKGEQVLVRTMTSQSDKGHAKAYGVNIPKDSRNNLNKDSTIMCTQDNTVYMNKEEVRNCRKVGEISNRQLLEVYRKVKICNVKNIQMRKSATLGRQQ